MGLVYCYLRDYIAFIMVNKLIVMLGIKLGAYKRLALERLREKRVLNGTKKCRKCIVCSYVLEGNIIQSKNSAWKINKKVSCQDSNIIYLIECQKERCKLRYIGFTTQEFRERMCQHLGYIRNKNSNKANGEHFNLPGHSRNDFKCTIIEKVRSVDPLYGREREQIHIIIPLIMD